ncbi:hypothetical protein ScPMuIL_002947 [Solemya velum]
MQKLTMVCSRVALLLIIVLAVAWAYDAKYCKRKHLECEKTSPKNVCLKEKMMCLRKYCDDRAAHARSTRQMKRIRITCYVNNTLHNDHRCMWFMSGRPVRDREVGVQTTAGTNHFVIF